MALGLDPAVNIIENGKCMIKERYLSGSGCGSVGRAVVILIDLATWMPFTFNYQQKHWFHFRSFLC